jgi:hypothetical protein
LVYLECWPSLNVNKVWIPDEELVNFLILTLKQPSPLLNPANQLGSGILLFSIKGLWIDTILGNAVFKSSDKPKFIDALIATVFKPFIDKCYLLLIRSTAFLNKIKSAFCCVIKGYLSKMRY